MPDRRRFIGCLVMVLFVMLPGMALSAVTQGQLERLQLDIWGLRTEFYMFTVMDGSDEYRDNLSDAVNRLDGSFDDFAAAVESDAARELLDRIREDVDNLREIGRRSLQVEGGDTDHYDRQDLDHYSAEVSLALRDYEGAEPGDHDELHRMATVMQRMTSEYIALVANPAGGMATGTDAGRVDFHEMVPRFDGMLESALENYGDNDSARRSLEAVRARWNFIRESLINFNEDAVPYLVHRYNHEIVENFRDVAG